MELLAEVILIDESVADCRNADKKLAASSPLYLYLAHSSIRRMSFQLGSRPSISSLKMSVPSSGVGGAMGEKRSYCIGFHCLSA